MSKEDACIEALSQFIIVISLKYSRPLVERLKIRLTVNFVGGDSQTIYILSQTSNATLTSLVDDLLKVRGPLVQTLCIEKDSHMDAI